MAGDYSKLSREMMSFDSSSDKLKNNSIEVFSPSILFSESTRIRRRNLYANIFWQAPSLLDN